MILIGIDTGGTFTDFVVYDGTRLRVHKELSTPDAPERAILAGLASLGIDRTRARIVHGSTVATNTLLEGKGARTVFVTNRGFADTLTIGRQARPALYELKPVSAPPPVPPALCLETGGRLGADGSVVDDLGADDLAALVTAVTACAPEAVAVSLLFSFLDDRFERAIVEALPDTLFVTRSSEVLPEYREYERGMATWLNAYVGPVMQRYLERLGRELAPAPLSIMQSSGVTAEPDFAARRAVNLLLSGPAGGLEGARHVAQAAGHARILTFDMGGTSTDVALIDGDIALTSEGAVGRYPVAVPMVDMHTIGAGGGSLAHVDAAGVLHVGPESAGAVPGPACYGQGGTQATVTDANLVLGRLPGAVRLGGNLALDVDAAWRALTRLGEALGGLSAEEAARGVVAMANEHMQQALRVISVERGIDPRDFTLVSFGGAGGLHVCALAEALGMQRALVPATAGVLSALGMVVARPGRRLSRTVRAPLDACDAGDLAARFEEVAAPGLAALAREGHAAAEIACAYSVDVCYRGQSFALNLPWTDHAALAEAFHAAHAQRYGHRLDLPLELVNLRVALDVVTPAAPVTAASAARARHAAPPAAGGSGVFARETLVPGARFAGPAIVYDAIATAHVDAGWHAQVDGQGNLALTRNPQADAQSE
ncbi:MAG: hydantoinase/oxoprolinase family protein [Gammaproteobacteria bacterium]